MIAITIKGTVPDELLKEFLQCVRTFDLEHYGCHFEMSANSDDLSDSQMLDAINGIDPPFKFISMHKKQ